jgi:hypothetical protein
MGLCICKDFYVHLFQLISSGCKCIKKTDTQQANKTLQLQYLPI